MAAADRSTPISFTLDTPLSDVKAKPKVKSTMVQIRIIIRALMVVFLSIGTSGFTSGIRVFTFS
jgi:hypothetical protein